MLRVVYLGKQQEQDPLEKYGEDGKRMLVMLEDPEVAEAVLRRLSGKLGGRCQTKKTARWKTGGLVRRRRER